MATVREFVINSFEAFLGRRPDEATLNEEVDSLEDGDDTPGNFIEDLIQSDEAQAVTLPIARVYEAALDRPPETEGLLFWSDLVRQGFSLPSIADAVVAAPEFEQRFGELSDPEFVSAIYANLLGRAPDPAGRAFFNQQLDAGVSRGTVLAQVASSEEFVNATQDEIETDLLFQALLNRPVAEGDLDDRPDDLGELAEDLLDQDNIDSGFNVDQEDLGDGIFDDIGDEISDVFSADTSPLIA